jgi:dinuclear metal center YbgI/SA1388 family protein
MRLAELVAVLEEIAPPRFAERWDNVGLLVGDREREVSRVLLAIDYTPDVAAEALDRGCEAVIAYHPPIFEGLKRLTAGDAIFEAIRRGVALYSPHTALDVAAGGTNDVLADALGLEAREPLKVPEAPGLPGMGRLGALPAVPREELIARTKRALGLERLLVAGPRTGVVRRAAVCAGACGDLLDVALRRGAELYLTGELRHHDALKAAKAGVTVLCTLHSNSERATLAVLARRLGERLSGLELILSQLDKDPFSII